MNKCNFRIIDNDNNNISLEEIDKMICDAFGLEYNNKNSLGEIDYGHFILDKDKYGQDYISWYGLINTIILFGDIPSGIIQPEQIAGVYSVKLWKKCFTFPDESLVLVAQLMQFFERHRLHFEIFWHW